MGKREIKEAAGCVQAESRSLGGISMMRDTRTDT
jgi:hypothetical protein